MSKLTITKGENKDSVLIEKLKRSPLPIVLYGVGLIADTAELFLNENGLHVSNRTLDDKYMTDQKYMTDAQQPGTVLSISQLQQKYSAYHLLLCFFRGYREDLTEFTSLFPGAQTVDYLSSIYDRGVLESMDQAYLLGRVDEFNRIYNLLEDRLSKDSMQAYLNAKINKDARYLFPYVRRPQYFSESGTVKDLTFHNSEVLVNCGAFTGDTLKDFLKISNGQFQKIYACEPDPVNLKVLQDFIHKAGIADRTKVVDKCLGDKREVVHFLSQGTMLSRVVQAAGGETTVAAAGDVTAAAVAAAGGATATAQLFQADTLDNLLDGERISALVMDVEGNELKVLQGAQKTIQRDEPLLALAAYHKNDDLLVLTDYLRELVPDYRFYFRVHKPMAIDAVLYASKRGG
ncbi:MAG: FkbM family methyltransferase [Bacteroidales bacterium]|nr:FkbM family methyltransferase [Bacteroidales bacterium]